MTETTAPPESPAAESPHLPRPETDHAALCAIDEAKQQLEILNGQDRVLAILDNFASRDIPGRQREIQDCVNKILAKVDSEPAAS